MQTPSPAQKLEIARRVHETFDLPKRWHRGDWGLDDNGYTIEFDGNLHVVDKDGAYQPAAFDVLTPESPRCLCLGAAIRIHTGHVLGHDPFDTGETTETVSEIYTRVGRIDTKDRELDAADFEPHLNSIIGWNDANERSYDDVRDLTGAVLRHLEARRW